MKVLRAKRGGVLRTARNKRSGSVVVEFALVAPLLIMITATLVQFALYANATISLTQIVREGARRAIVAGTSTSADTSVISAMQNASVGTVINSSDISSSTVTVSPAASTRAPGTSVTVTLTYNLDKKRFLPKTFFGITLYKTNVQKTATMRMEGQT